ncbi:MAG: hypothetical protein M1834_003401 [Cirrosporium novae-zelandiae]|nr:MAG: hypothetical protein M1834_003401 [Cirrosporium novae-zelandiae]
MSQFGTFTKKYHHTAQDIDDSFYSALCVTGKVVFITGGGRNIGKSIGLSFAKAGASAIVITGRTESSLLSAKNEIENATTGTVVVRTFLVDVRDAKETNAVFSLVRAELGPIDVLVTNAGYLDQHKTISESDIEDYWRCFEINVKGILITTQAFLRGSTMEGATIINITSGAGHIPYIPGYSAYSCSKAAGARVMEYVQAENPKLRVFNLQPGAIETDMSRKAGNMETEDDLSLPAAFSLRLMSPGLDFLKGRLVWANWDVQELKEREKEIIDADLLTMRLNGFRSGP